ncbi:unnamed protein product, partial [Rhizoctonia solani]
ALVESEDKLCQVLEDLGHRDPAGMLSDFDLHTQHSSPLDLVDATHSVSANDGNAGAVRPRDEDTKSTMGRKRRKANSTRSVPVEQGGKTDADQGQSKKQKGTPAFMAAKVLQVPPGEPYHHSFIYDLESFFWLIFWSAAAHLDNNKARPAPDAQEVLDNMNQHNLKSI